jgi:hypothetical protein
MIVERNRRLRPAADDRRLKDAVGPNRAGVEPRRIDPGDRRIAVRQGEKRKGG